MANHHHHHHHHHHDSSDHVHLEVYAHNDCPMRDFAEVMSVLEDHMSKGKCTVNEVTEHTPEGKYELKRCEVKCESREEADELIDKLQGHPKVKKMTIVKPRHEGIDYTCTIL